MSSDRWILAIDLGNGGPKVAVVDLNNEIRGVAVRAVSVNQGLHGLSTQDAAEWWDQLLDAAKESITSSAVDPLKIQAVGITGQWGSTVPVD